jgi:hypothetical protein
MGKLFAVGIVYSVRCGAVVGVGFVAAVPPLLPLQAHSTRHAITKTADAPNSPAELFPDSQFVTGRMTAMKPTERV